MATQSNTKQERTRKSKSRAELRKQLARDLASVLANPETPSILYNDIADHLCDMSAEIDYNTPEMIEASLEAHRQREEKRTKGAKR